MNKKIIAIIVIVLAVIVFFVYKGKTSPATTDGTPSTSTTVTTTTNTTTTGPNVVTTQTDPKVLQKLQNVSVSVAEDGSKVNLANGTASFTPAGSNTKSSVSVGSVATAKTFGSRNDIIAVLNLSSGGVISQYLVLFQDSGSTVTQKSIAYLGQSLDVRGIVTADLGTNSGQEYVISVTALTQKPNVTQTTIVPVKSGAFDTANTISF